MLGPNNTSLLHKLNKQLAHEMPLAQLEALVTKAQEKRSIDRAIGRLHKMITDPRDGTQCKPHGPKVKRSVNVSPKALTLESSGLAPQVAVMLRKQWSGKTDSEILSLLSGKGLL